MMSGHHRKWNYFPIFARPKLTNIYMKPITLEEMKSVKLMNRTDTKFVTSRAVLDRLLELIDEEYLVQVTEGSTAARYHTLYYDTEDCRMYLIHHNGHKTRQKLRVRSYVDSDLHFLEVKTKNNHGKTRKRRISLDLELPSGVEATSGREIGDVLAAMDLAEHDDFLSDTLWYPSARMQPKIENRFTRMTLVNRKKTERLTIDTDLRFTNRVTGRTTSLEHVAIIELKRDSLRPSPIMPHLNRLRIFSMGFSKYCMGMALTDQGLKQNLFKERLRRIGKL